MDSILFGRYPTRCFQSLITEVESAVRPARAGEGRGGGGRRAPPLAPPRRGPGAAEDRATHGVRVHHRGRE